MDILKKRAAVRLLMPSSNIHISHKESELRYEKGIQSIWCLVTPYVNPKYTGDACILAGS